MAQPPPDGRMLVDRALGVAAGGKVTWEKLTFVRELGRGQFGTVGLYTLDAANGMQRDVAVKKLTDDPSASEVEQFRIEFRNMVKVPRAHQCGECDLLRRGHEKAGNRHGFREWRKPALVAEEVENDGTMQSTAIGIISAVRHLHTCGILHRDLAARNAIVCVDDQKRFRNIVLTDFGLSADISGSNGAYVETLAKPTMPAAWSVMESLRHGLWTRESDVWSLGVLVWEIFVNGDTPYHDEMVDISRANVPEFVEERKKRLDVADIPRPVDAALLRCWDASPYARPTLNYIEEMLKRYLQSLGPESSTTSSESE